MEDFTKLLSTDFTKIGSTSGAGIFGAISLILVWQGQTDTIAFWVMIGISSLFLLTTIIAGIISIITKTKTNKTSSSGLSLFLQEQKLEEKQAINIIKTEVEKPSIFNHNFFKNDYTTIMYDVHTRLEQKACSLYPKGQTYVIENYFDLTLKGMIDGIKKWIDNHSEEINSTIKMDFQIFISDFLNERERIVKLACENLKITDVFPKRFGEITRPELLQFKEDITRIITSSTLYTNYSKLHAILDRVSMLIHKIYSASLDDVIEMNSELDIEYKNIENNILGIHSSIKDFKPRLGRKQKFSKYSSLIDFVFNNGITENDIIITFGKILSRIDLEEHKLFVYGHNYFKTLIESSKEFARSKGQCWVINTFLNIQLETYINRVKAFLQEHKDIIANESETFDINTLINVMYDIVDSTVTGKEGYEVLAKRKKIENIFIDTFKPNHRKNIINVLVRRLDLVKTNSYLITDTARVAVALDILYDSLIDAFDIDYLKRIYAESGKELDEFYNKVNSNLQDYIVI